MAIKNSGTDQLVKDGESTKLLQLHEQGIDVVSDVVQLLDDKSLGCAQEGRTGPERDKQDIHQSTLSCVAATQTCCTE